MSSSATARIFDPPQSSLRLAVEVDPQECAAYWRINGYRARLLIWTRDEWEQMETPPSDAQFHPAGVWCALRLD
jgi:hypothetical protein